MTVGSPPSSTATTELVVPRSMPTARAMLLILRVEVVVLESVALNLHLERTRLNYAMVLGIPRIDPIPAGGGTLVLVESPSLAGAWSGYGVPRRLWEVGGASCEHVHGLAGAPGSGPAGGPAGSQRHPDLARMAALAGPRSGCPEADRLSQPVRDTVPSVRRVGRDRAGTRRRHLPDRRCADSRRRHRRARRTDLDHRLYELVQGPGSGQR